MWGGNAGVCKRKLCSYMLSQSPGNMNALYRDRNTMRAQPPQLELRRTCPSFSQSVRHSRTHPAHRTGDPQAQGPERGLSGVEYPSTASVGAQHLGLGRRFGRGRGTGLSEQRLLVPLLARRRRTVELSVHHGAQVSMCATEPMCAGKATATVRALRRPQRAVMSRLIRKPPGEILKKDPVSKRHLAGSEVTLARAPRSQTLSRDTSADTPKRL